MGAWDCCGRSLGTTVEGQKGIRDVAISRDGRYLYALHADAQQLFGWHVEKDGSLMPVGAFGGLPTTVVGLAASWPADWVRGTDGSFIVLGCAGRPREDDPAIDSRVEGESGRGLQRTCSCHAHPAMSNTGPVVVGLPGRPHGRTWPAPTARPCRRARRSPAWPPSATSGSTCSSTTSSSSGPSPSSADEAGREDQRDAGGAHRRTNRRSSSAGNQAGGAT
jgi:hypothetical protein